MKEIIYSTKQIHFEYQCYEDFSSMPKNDMGLYCKSCDKNLVDFTGNSILDIKTYLKENRHQEVCGIFSENQIQNEINVFPTNKPKTSLFTPATNILILMSTLLVSCGSSEEKTGVENEKIDLKEENKSLDQEELYSKDTIQKKKLNNLDSKTNVTNVNPSKGKKKKNEPNQIEEVTVAVQTDEHPVVLGGIPVMEEHYDPTLSDEPCTYVDEAAQFPGGEKELIKFINNNLVYPPLAKEEKIQGKVYIEFVVRKDGSITDIRVAKGTQKLLDNAAVDLMKLMPKWEPGKVKGKNVDSRLYLPINFRLP